MVSDPMTQAPSFGGGAAEGQPGESVTQTASRAVSKSYNQAQEATDQVTAFIRGQPVAAAIIALGLGYVLGRLRI